MKKDIMKKERNTRMKKIRINSGMTQKAFAETLGMSREGYQKVERGVNNLSLDVLERMKTIYGISSDYLLFGERKDTNTVWEILQNCSEQTKLELVIRLIAYFTVADRMDSSQEKFRMETFLDKIQEKGRKIADEENYDIDKRSADERANSRGNFIS